MEKVGLIEKRTHGNIECQGYQQRVGLAQALLHSPKYLILDEPASGLDPSQMVEIREMLKILAEETSILLSTHLLSEAERMCTHHIILHEGRVALSGSLSELGQYHDGGGLVLKLLTRSGRGGVKTNGRWNMLRKWLYYHRLMSTQPRL